MGIYRHSEGEWVAEEWSNNDTNSYAVAAHHGGGVPPTLVALVSELTHSDGTDIAAANAQLIAAAPELLEAARMALTYLDDTKDNCGMCRMHLEDAVKKAVGEVGAQALFT